jgi:uncharacterized protein
MTIANGADVAAPTGLPNAADLWSRAPRKSWWQRAVQVAPVRIVIGVLFTLPAAGLTSLSRRWPSGAIYAVIELAATLVFLAGLVGFATLVERRPTRELSPRGGVLEWLAGFAIGTLLLAATAGILVLLGAYRIETGGQVSAVGHGLLGFLPQSLFEEVLMRALFFKIVEEALGSWPAMVIQAALFGVMHLGNPGASAFGALAIALEAGILLAAGYMYTRRLWLVWGLHLGWNWTQGSLFGIRVSGTHVSSSWLISQPKGADWLTGGSFGVEASPVAVVLCLAVALLVVRAAVRRGQVVGYREQRSRVRLILSGG